MMWLGWGGGWMALWMVLFWGGVALLVVWGLRALDPRTRDDDSRASRILDERFARGEIDDEEYARMSSAIRGR